MREALAGRSEELERLAIEMYARGLSVRDIEAAFTDRSGRCVLTRTAVCELTERLRPARYSAITDAFVCQVARPRCNIARERLPGLRTSAGQ